MVARERDGGLNLTEDRPPIPLKKPAKRNLSDCPAMAFECSEANCRDDKGGQKSFATEQGLRVHISKTHPILSALLIQQNIARKKSASQPQRTTRRAPTGTSHSQPPLVRNGVEAEQSGQPAVAEPEQQQSDTPTWPATPNGRESSAVVCPECNQQFGNQNALNSHMASHPAASNRIRLNRLGLGPSEAPDEATEDQTPAAANTLESECREWTRRFESMARDTAALDQMMLDTPVTEFLQFLSGATQRLPGPKHPNVKYYNRRKKGQTNFQPAQQSRSSNPQRTSQNKRKQNRARYEYELAQYEYYNQRRRVARRVMKDKPTSSCPIPMAELEAYFGKIFGTSNDNVREEYPHAEARENIEITLEEVNMAIQAISLDTSPGSDRVLIKTIRELKIGGAIKALLDVMLATGLVPSKLAEGKTILIPKDGDPNDCSNYRPITIYSIVRRIIERVLDRHLRQQVGLNCNQRGFVSMPGCHVNSKLINACLLDAKEKKSDCVVVFLDISKAFDRIGHGHVERSLAGFGVSRNMHRLIMSLLTSNTIKLNVGRTFSNSIAIKRSVPQGGPLSPLLFNISVDYIYRELCDAQFANLYGYPLRPEQTAISLTGFADDQAVTSSSTAGAARIVELVRDLFREIDLNINPSKSIAINIQKGKMIAGDLNVCDDMQLRCFGENERIKYLGCAFTSELVFNEAIITELTGNMNNLLETPLLQQDQKLSILNQYILPKLTYPLQMAPINKIPKQHLTMLDRTIRQTAKGALGLPIHSAPNSMLYSPRRYRGLGLVHAESEVQLQHFAIARRLRAVEDDLFHEVFDCEAEMSACKEALQVEGHTARQLRIAVREREFETWSRLPYAGVGVKHYKIHPQANRFVCNKSSLSSSEWVAAIKLNFHYANLAAVPGAKDQASSRFCRRCGNENETIGHVLGACEFGANRRNDRHHALKYKLAELLRENGFHTVDEAPCVDANGSNRRVDILAFDPKSNRAFIIDPTVRFETNREMDDEVQSEKSSTYEPCIPDLKERYRQFGDREFEVIGVWMGARGTVGTSLVGLFERFGLPKKQIPDLAEKVLSASLRMLHHHIYST